MSKRHRKRTPAFNQAQLELSFDAPARPTIEGALAGLERQVASAVAQMLKDDERNRFTIAGEVSALLDDDVSKAMLDAYASEARDGHNISFGRFLALVSVTGRYDVLDALTSKVGAKVVVGQEMLTVELGHIEAQIQRLQERRSDLRRVAPPIMRGQHK